MRSFMGAILRCDTYDMLRALVELVLSSSKRKGKIDSMHAGNPTPTKWPRKMTS